MEGQDVFNSPTFDGTPQTNPNFGFAPQNFTPPDSTQPQFYEPTPLPQPVATSKSKKGLVAALIGLLLAGGGVGAYFLLNRPSSTITISFANAKTFPGFSESETDYTIYTEADTLTPSCQQNGQPIDCGLTTFSVPSGDTRKTITIGDQSYDFYVTKVESATSPIEISAVTGTPKVWAPRATLYVETSQSTRDGFVEYSFDGGKTYSFRPSREITENGVYYIMLRDYFGYTSKVKTVKINLIDSVAPELALSSEETPDGRYTLAATYSDALSGVAAFAWSTKATTETITVEAGTYSATVADQAGNKTTRQLTVGASSSSSSSSQNNSSNELPNTSGGQSNNSQSTPPTPTPTPQPVSKTFTATFGSITRSCTTTGQYCDVVAPEITRDGWEILGWSQNADDASAPFASGVAITISGNTSFYPITRRKVVAEFKLQNPSAVTASDLVRSCYRYNSAETCTIDTPALSANSGYVALGWDADPSSRSAALATDSPINLGSSTTYYSVSRTADPLTLTFVVQDSNALISIPDPVSCHLYNTETSCTLPAPEITARNGFELLGWSEDPSLTPASALPVSFNISASTTLYSITRTATALQATFSYDIVGQTSAQSIARECYRYNGATSCQVSVPDHSNLGDPTIIGWSATSSGDKIYHGGDLLTLTTNASLFAYRHYSTPTSTTLTAHFSIQNSAAAQTSTSSVSCTLEDGATSCDITLPALTAKTGYTTFGWSQDPSAHSGTDAKTFTLTQASNGTTFYSITSRDLSADFIVADASTAATGADQLSCTAWNADTSCAITLPSLTGNNGYTASGWRRTADNKIYQPFAAFTLSSHETFTAVVTKNQITLSAEFIVQDSAAVSNPSRETKSCQADPGQTCAITLPTLAANSGYTALGWSETPSTTTSSHPSGSTLVLTKSSSTFYSVTRQTAPLTVAYSISPYQTSFLTLSGGTESCVLYNGATSCLVHTPLLISTDADYTPWGFIDTTDPSAQYFKPMDADVAISRNSTFEGLATYEPVKPDPEDPDEPDEPVTPSKTFTAHFIIQNPAAATADTTDLFCTTTGTSCAITLPTLTGLNGWQALGWSTRASDTTVTDNNYGTYAISGDTTFYSITSKEVRAIFTIEDTAAASKSGGTYSCYLYNTTTSCKLTAPTLTANPGYTASGWRTKDGSVTLASGESKYFAGSLDFYAVTSQNSSTLTATFTILNSAHVSETSTTRSCTTTGSSCQITAPNLTAKSGYSVLGWTNIPGSHSADLAAGAQLTISSNATFYSVTKTTSPLTASFVISDPNSATNRGDGQTTCDLYNAEATCNVVLPHLDAKTGYTANGWLKGTTLYQGGATVGISANTTFTASVTQNATEKTLTATFTVQNSSAAYASATSASCKTTGSSCQLAAPTLTNYSGYTALGWASNASATTANYTSGAAITISGGETFYSVTSKTIKINFINSNPTAGSIVGSATSASCTAWNAATSCSISLPSLTANSGYTVVGWGTSATATTAAYSAGSSASVSASADVYALFAKAAEPADGKVVTVTFRKGNATSLSYEKASCAIKTGEDYCTLGIYGPRITAPGHYFNSYLDKNGHTVRIPTMLVTEDTYVSLSEATNEWLRYFTLNTSKHYVMPNGLEVEFQDTIADDVVAYHIRAINALYQNLPILFITRGKVTYIDKDSMKEFMGQSGIHGVAPSSYYGSGVSTSDGQEVTNVFIAINVNEIRQPTAMTNGTSFDSDVVAHELTHAYDNFYKLHHGFDVGREDEMKELFYYYQEHTSNRPITSYAWSLISETFPEEVRLYFNRFNPDPLYSDDRIATIFPSQFEAFVEKYLCIGVNGFDRTKTTCNLSTYVPE